jgi:hypothetical protein
MDERRTQAPIPSFPGGRENQTTGLTDRHVGAA